MELAWIATFRVCTSLESSYIPFRNEDGTFTKGYIVATTVNQFGILTRMLV